MTFGEHGPREASAERKIGGDGGRPDAGRRLGAIDGCAKILLRTAFLVMQGSQVESEHEEIFRFEPWIDALRVLHAANK